MVYLQKYIKPCQMYSPRGCIVSSKRSGSLRPTLPIGARPSYYHFSKKDDRRLCSDYRGISLIDVAAKVLAVLLLRRFQGIRDLRTRPSQGGFRPGRGCVDQIFSLRHTLKQRWAYQQPTVLCFVDFAAAFDSVDRGSPRALPVDASTCSCLW
ncbi:unnamed protein product [Acanthosepion pharaonis]|uniref:Reverse transcriptase domain-containing protein n=1 Tax=Acanthosepion pharaonis TaxID=158019 RepID=A0A812EU49_ACAPH|nr:unnamed protein product [Sepia pharaonis]